MEVMNFIKENIVVLVPVLYIIGEIMKGSQVIKDKYIPAILLVVGVAFSLSILGFNVDGIIQGILVAGATVLGNQLVKQASKGVTNSYK